MKSPVAVTLIIVGGLLILGPVIADHSARSQVVAIMNEQKLTTVTLNPPPMSGSYRFGCWFVGTLMIATAVFSSVARGPRAKVE